MLTPSRRRCWRWQARPSPAGLAAPAWRERVAIGEALLHWLEQRFPVWRSETADPVVGIVALGESFTARRLPAERVTAAAALAHRFPSAKVLFSGIEETAGASRPHGRMPPSSRALLPGDMRCPSRLCR